MKRNLILTAMAVVSLLSVSCNKETAPVSQNGTSAPVVTKAYGDKTPKIVVYVETNDVNPVNAGDYLLADGSQFVDIVELFAANVHKDGNGDPCIYFNDKLAPVMENIDEYIVPLQQKGIKVVLTTLGDWQNIGVANMTDSQAQKFAEILAYVVDAYGLDGIGFDDEYSGTSVIVAGSWGRVIEKLRALLPVGKLITVFSYGHTSQISSAQGAMIDYAYTNFSLWNGTPGISGVTKDRWAPMSLNLGNSYTSSLNTIKNNAKRAKDGGYGALMNFNLRTASDVSPLPVFNAIAEGAFNSSVTIAAGGGNRPRAAAGDPVTITYDDL